MGDMPRPPEATPLRRILEQVIMWLVLAATVGAAAWVDTELRELGAPITFDGITLQPPKRWNPTDEHDGENVLELRERGESDLARTLTVRRPSLSIRSIFRGAPKRSEQVTLADGVVAKISVVETRVAADPEVGTVSQLEVVAVFTPPAGDALAMTLSQYSVSPRSDTARNEELMKRILETVRFVGPS